MALTRGELMRRALVGSAVLVMPKLPTFSSPAVEELVQGPGIVRITGARTGLPTAARYLSVDDTIALLEPDETPLVELMRRERLGWKTDGPQGTLRAVTAQRVEWLEDELMPRWSDVAKREMSPNAELGIFTLPPQSSQFFWKDDIIRDEHNGNNYLITRVDHEVGKLYVRELGFTKESAPLVSPEDELKALIENAPEGTFEEHPVEHLDLLAQQRKRMTSYDEWRLTDDGKRTGFDY